MFLRILRSIRIYRYHFIPVLISVVYVAAIILAWQRSPAHYRREKIFHLSALGNWQEGLSFFSVGLVLIGSLMHTLAEEILLQRMEQINEAENEAENEADNEADNEAENAHQCRIKICPCQCPCIYWFGSIILFLGLVITGCFQQSFNKPWHVIGLFLIASGFVAMFLYDQSFSWCRKTSAGERKGICNCIAKWFQIIIFSAILVSGILCVTTNAMAQCAWNAGKDAELDELVENGTLTEKKCPGKSVNDWLNGTDYPDYYPCKSKSLWEKEDPGFNLYIISAISEVFMFTVVVLYSCSYCCLLKKKKEWPVWAPKCLIERADREEKAKKEKREEEEKEKKPEEIALV